MNCCEVIRTCRKRIAAEEWILLGKTYIDWQSKEDFMPYKTLGDLPENVRNHLPKHAQEIYRAAFNNAWDEYNHEEERAHRVAWAAVEHQYEKDEESGNWKRKQATRRG
jgi:cation transport regulator